VRNALASSSGSRPAIELKRSSASVAVVRSFHGKAAASRTRASVFGEFAADASDEVGRRGLLQEDLAGGGEQVWYYSANRH
jgi:hypothetical protein